MSITSLDKLKSYFKTGAKPTQEQFHALLDSYIHKGEDTAYILKGLEGATFMGVATPDSVPPVPTQKVFYIANEVGAYPNYGGLSVADGEIAFFTYNGSWSKVALEDVAKKSEIEKKITELELLLQNDSAQWQGGTSTKKLFYDENAKVVDITSNPAAGDLGVSSTDIFLYVGQEVKVKTHCVSSAFNLIVDEDNTILEKWQQDGSVKEILVPERAFKILLSNDFRKMSSPFLSLTDKLSIVSKEVKNLAEQVKDLNEDGRIITTKPGYVALLGGDLLSSVVSSGYTLTHEKNETDINIDYWDILTKKSGESIYPIKYEIFRKSGNLIVWIRKSDYIGGLRFHVASINNGSVVYNVVDFKQNEIGLNASKQSALESVMLSAICIDQIEDLYCFTISYQAPSDNCKFVPYEFNGVSGAVVDKSYKLACWSGTDSKRNIGKFNLGVFEDKVRLFLPKRMVFELNKAGQIFKHSICSAFNYRNYNIQVVLDAENTSCKDYHRYIEYQPQATGIVNATFRLYDNSRKLLDEQVVEFVTYSRQSQPSTMKTILFIGDSLTFYNRLTDEFVRVLTSNDSRNVVKDTLSIYDVVKFGGRGWGNIQLIGTQKQNYKGWTGVTYHEGYSGWSWRNFTQIGSPFVYDGNININRYLSENGFATPDIVYIGLGWNDQKYISEVDGTFGVSAIMADAEKFLDDLSAQLPSSKIRLWTENVPGIYGGIGNHPYGASEAADEQKMKLIQLTIADGYLELVKKYHNVEVVWATAFIDSENALQETTAAINTRINKTEVVGVDYVHPADSGFFQIADVIISDFVSLL